MQPPHLTDQKITDLDLTESLKQGLVESGFEYCTPIQAASLPIALAGKDVAGQAQTGTGKTVAFLLACANHLSLNRPPQNRHPAHIRALILAPTRELAIQIHRDAVTLLQHAQFNLGLAYGGTGYEQQKQCLEEGVDILIGTPGRLIDFYRQNLFGLKHIQSLVIDEADRMFDLGFIRDIRFLLRRMPEPARRLNLLFSATLSFRVMELAYEHMNSPEDIRIDEDMRIASKIDETCFYPSDEEKPVLMVNLLKRHQPERALIFVNTRHAVESVARIITANGIDTAILSGEVPQKKREELLNGFKQGQYRCLVATDVAARGLHIPDVDYVFNYDLPQNAEDYVHRIGRTARAGKSGHAVSFLCERYAYSIEEIEQFLGHSIPKISLEMWMLEPITAPDPQTGSGTRRNRSGRSEASRNGRSPAAAPRGKDPRRGKPPPPAGDTASPAQADEAARPEASAKDGRDDEPVRRKLPGRIFSKKFGEVPLVG